MEGLPVSRRRTGAGMLAIAVVLLVGIVILAAGYFGHNRTALYAGLLITLAGVMTGVWRLILSGES